jgi:hypothetical protein
METAMFSEALRADGPHPDQSAAPDLYGWLVGSWDAEVVDHLPDGGERRQSAEMHFAWVLEGRAIQDLWIVPARLERGSTAGPGNRYGTTFRMWDAELAAWRIRWVNPVTGIETTLVGRQVGDEIVQTGSDAAGRLVRWNFDTIQPNSFHWRGDISEDGGRTWTCQAEFFAHRRAGA